MFAIIAVLPIAFHFDAFEAVWLLIGSMFLVHLWTGQKFAYWTRSDKPLLFWGVFALFLFMTARGAWTVFELINGGLR